MNLYLTLPPKSGTTNCGTQNCLSDKSVEGFYA
jgi:hypothetical protein